MIKPRFVNQAEDANGFEKAQWAESVRVGGIFSGFKAHAHMALGGQIINFVGFNILHQAHHIIAIGHVAMMHEKAHIALMRVDINIVNTLRIKRGCAAFNAVDFIALLQQQTR